MPLELGQPGLLGFADELRIQLVTRGAEDDVHARTVGALDGGLEEAALVEEAVELRRLGVVDLLDGGETAALQYPVGHKRDNSAEKTENTRVSYPIYHIDNIVRPVSRGTHPSKIIFLSADAFGVLPPVSILNKEQTMYYYLSGYTAKLAGTERGIVTPQPTFSSCFGAAFLLLHPTKYAEELAKKLEEHNATAYLVNTGWAGGGYGVGERISLKATRAIITAILNDELKSCETEIVKPFNLVIPKHVTDVDDNILNPENSWTDKEAFKKNANELAAAFIKNFANFSDTEEGKALIPFGPQI